MFADDVRGIVSKVSWGTGMDLTGPPLSQSLSNSRKSSVRRERAVAGVHGFAKPANSLQTQRLSKVCDHIDSQTPVVME